MNLAQKNRLVKARMLFLLLESDGIYRRPEMVRKPLPIDDNLKVKELSLISPITTFFTQPVKEQYLSIDDKTYKNSPSIDTLRPTCPFPEASDYGS
ncbi:hypothetical protein GCM10027347_60390 [Larkinella harenae]